MTKTSLPDDNPKTAFGAAKPPLFPIPPVAILQLGLAMESGRKYGFFNWRERTITFSIYYDAMLRHLFRYLDGEEIDPDSSVHHLAHVMASCAIILDAQANGKFNDDRPRPGRAGQLIDKLTEKRSQHRD